MDSRPLTLLRIKRKRTEEPLDALLVQTQASEKRPRKENEALSVPPSALPTIFRLAETVDEKGFKNAAEAQKLKDRISSRVNHRIPETVEERKDRLMQQKMNTIRQARYRVVQQNRNSTNLSDMKDMFDMYEAVREEEHQKKTPKLFPDEDNADDEDIMCNFIPMVKEYLTLNERKQADEDDYVYDVYYQDDSQSGAFKDLNVGSLIWFNEETQYMNDDTDSERGDYEDEDSNAEDYYQNDYPDEESGEDYEEQYGYSSDDDDGQHQYY